MAGEDEGLVVVGEARGGMGAAGGVGLARKAEGVVHEGVRDGGVVVPVGHPGWESQRGLVGGSDGSAGCEEVEVGGLEE